MTAASRIVVEQLNRSQWHALVPGERATGVGNYVQALSDSLEWGELNGLAVVTVALDGTERLVAVAAHTVLAPRGVLWAW